ncbi:inositol monophosphatase family protein [Amaricoccus sp.]|uniref:inositol monophosphatase family protein n=1 Tax=Amaricoccus sp. TaxID=1872485 RepID=UPI001B47726B|nr:inositol monophosphatase family protein [Amaricoccus sp.]MBP7001434.1 hypothetical protein [Amaricoccus sp.]
MPEIEARRALALAVASEAGAVALDFWRRRAGLAIEEKAGAQDIVSEADRAVERLIRARVAAAFPEDGFLGEEYGPEPGASGFTWVIDPIDGTSPYLHGMPTWCVALAVARGSEAVVGVVEVPTHGETFAAALGRGATLNDAALRIPEGVNVTNAATAVGASHRTDPAWIGRVAEALGRQGGVFFRNGSGALMLAHVAAGRLAGYVEPHMHSWDALGALLIIREAGGVTGPFPEAGDLGRGGAAVAASPAAWEAVSALAAPVAAGAGDRTAPILPSRDLDAAAAFWARLGFAVRYLDPAQYLIVARGGAELHFWRKADLEPGRNDAGAYLRSGDLDGLAAACAAAGLPARGVPRYVPPEVKPWGMRELALVDADGNLLRAGTDA